MGTPFTAVRLAGDQEAPTSPEAESRFDLLESPPWSRQRQAGAGGGNGRYVATARGAGSSEGLADDVKDGRLIRGAAGPFKARCGPRDRRARPQERGRPRL